MVKSLEHIVDESMEWLLTNKIKISLGMSIGFYYFMDSTNFLNLGTKGVASLSYLITRGLILGYEYLSCGYREIKNLTPLVFGAAALAINRDSEYIDSFGVGLLIGDIVMEAFNHIPKRKNNNSVLERVTNFIYDNSLLIGTIVTAEELARGIPTHYADLDNSIFWMMHSAAWGGLATVSSRAISVFSPHKIKNYFKSIKAVLYSFDLNKSIKLYKEIINDPTSNREKAFTLLKLGDSYFDAVNYISDEEGKREVFSLALNSYHSAFDLIMNNKIKGFAGMPPSIEYGCARSVVLDIINDMPRKARQDIKRLKKKSNDERVSIFSGMMYEYLGDVKESENEYCNGVREILSSGKYKFRNLLSTNNPVMVVDDPFLGGLILIKSFNNENDALNEFNISRFVYYSVRDDLEVQFPISILKIDNKYACVYRMVGGVDLITKSKTGVLPAELISKSLDVVILYMDKCSSNFVNHNEFGIKHKHKDYFRELKKAASRIGINEDKDVDAGIELIVRKLGSQVMMFTHGDYHPGNTILINDGSIGIIDQENSDMGPVQDACASFLTSSYLGVRSDLSEFVSEHYGNLVKRDINIYHDKFIEGLYFCSLRCTLKKLGVATLRLGGNNPQTVVENSIHRSHYLWMFYSLFDSSKSSIVSFDDVRKTISTNEYDILRRFGDKLLKIDSIS